MHASDGLILILQFRGRTINTGNAMDRVAVLPVW